MFLDLVEPYPYSVGTLLPARPATLDSRAWCWAIAALLVFSCQLVWLATSLPVFHHIDEPLHVDDALKLWRSLPLDPGSPVEPEVRAWMTSHQSAADYRYLGKSPTPDASALRSYETYQSSLPYRFAAVVARPLVAEISCEAGLRRATVALRLACVLAMVAARIALLVVIHRTLGRRGLLALLPFIAFWLPVDMVRFSNDSFAHCSSIIGMCVASLALSERPDDRLLLLAAAALALGVACKLSVLLFGVPAAALLFFAGSAAPLRTRIQSAALLTLPAGIVGAILVLGVPGTALHPLDTSHLTTGAFPSATGASLTKAIPTLPDAYTMLLSLAVPGTLIGGASVQSGSMAQHSVTLLIVVLCLGTSAAVSGESPRLRRLSLATILWLVATLITQALLESQVGRVHWRSGRFALLGEPLLMIVVGLGALRLQQLLDRWSLLVRALPWILSLWLVTLTAPFFLH